MKVERAKVELKMKDARAALALFERFLETEYETGTIRDLRRQIQKFTEAIRASEIEEQNREALRLQKRIRESEVFPWDLPLSTSKLKKALK